MTSRPTAIFDPLTLDNARACLWGGAGAFFLLAGLSLWAVSDGRRIAAIVCAVASLPFAILFLLNVSVRNLQLELEQADRADKATVAAYFAALRKRRKAERRCREMAAAALRAERTLQEFSDLVDALRAETDARKAA